MNPDLCGPRYAVLAGLCFTPELYCCGVDVVGPSHVLTLFQSIPPYWAPIKKQLIDRVGDVENDDEVNRRISPLYHVDKITCACQCKPPCARIPLCAALSFKFLATTRVPHVKFEGHFKQHAGNQGGIVHLCGAWPPRLWCRNWQTPL